VSSASGPPGVVRVALTDFRWPLDPALAQGRDETTLARALYATPLRTDPATGAVVPGLCSAWTTSSSYRVWRFQCRSAPAIAAALRRVRKLTTAPAHWLFADARVSVAGGRLVVRLPYAWRRFPYALTVAGAAPRTVPGPFQLVSGSPQLVVARSGTVSIMFRRFTVRGAGRAFERGEIDEAPVPVGDIAWTRSRLGDVVRARTLLALDGVSLRRLASALRRVYWETANRSDYAELVPESRGAATVSVVATDAKAKANAFRDAVNAIGSLPRVRVRIGVPPQAEVRYGARLLYAGWRDVGLGPELVTTPARALAGSFERWAALYPQAEAIPAELVLRDGLGSRSLLLRALAATEQGHDLDAFDADLRASARVVPVAWVADARLVSPRLVGWREGPLGDVDYSGVKAVASSRPR
jgi:hypothetical protein